MEPQEVSPELYELLRKCLVMGGPLADDAIKVIKTQHPLHEVSFMYPHSLGDNIWQAVYRHNPTA